MPRTIEAVIRLRRDNDYNFEPIKNTFVPASGEVYADAQKNTPLVGMINKIYIDKDTSTVWYYNGVAYVSTAGSSVSNASSATSGIMRLYNTTGQNTDGTMTQKSITDELDLRYKASVNTSNEELIFTL